MTFRQLEDNINLWLNELATLEVEFHDQAGNINRADSLLVNNASKIIHLHETLEKLKSEHSSIDRQLDFVIYQQNELEKLLEPLESLKLFEISPSDPASAEREFTYNLVESVNNDLDSISSDLESFIKKINDIKSPSGVSAFSSTADPVIAINKVLNAHMDALVYIEQQVNSLKAALELN